MDPSQSDQPAAGRARWIPWIGMLLALLLLLGLGAWCGPGAGSVYLDLQRASDGVHRFAVFGLPGAFTALVLGLLGRRVLRARAKLRGISTALCWIALGFAALLLGAVFRFDRAIEDKGLCGQLVVFSPTTGQADPGAPRMGPFEEGRDGPGVASGELAGGDLVTLDRRAIARKSVDGRFRWSRPRPGRGPAALLIVSDVLLVLGPSAEFDDDLVLSALDVSSGALRWAFHCLGVSFAALGSAGREVTFRSQRPAGSFVYRLDWASGQDTLPRR